VLEGDDLMELFSEVCASLSIDDLAKLRRHTESPERHFSTWLVTIVHHQCIDWVRQREGRRRVRTPPGLSPLQQEIFERVFVDRHSHVETYELIKNTSHVELSFSAFLKVLAETYRAVERATGKAAARYLAAPPPLDDNSEPTLEETVVAAESASELIKALEVLPADERLAIQLFVIDELPAERVARVVGWPNAKAVYNRVYRALLVLRRELERRGVDRVGP
jgi:RNA polymerase sigma factor (sigma-70 family)